MLALPARGSPHRRNSRAPEAAALPGVIRRVDSHGPASRGGRLLPWPRTPPLPWHEFFVGTIGAAAALTGLLSLLSRINLDQILEIPSAAGESSCDARDVGEHPGHFGFALAPGQSIRALGIEIASAAAVVAVQAVWVSLGKRTPGEPSAWQIEHLATLLLPASP